MKSTLAGIALVALGIATLGGCAAAADDGAEMPSVAATTVTTQDEEIAPPDDTDPIVVGGDGKKTIDGEGPGGGYFWTVDVCPGGQHYVCNVFGSCRCIY